MMRNDENLGYERLILRTWINVMEEAVCKSNGVSDTQRSASECSNHVRDGRIDLALSSLQDFRAAKARLYAMREFEEPKFTFLRDELEEIDNSLVKRIADAREGKESDKEELDVADHPGNERKGQEDSSGVEPERGMEEEQEKDPKKRQRDEDDNEEEGVPRLHSASKQRKGANVRFTITVPADDDTCGENLDLAGSSFDVFVVLYHRIADAWVVEHVDTGAHYFVNAEFFSPQDKGRIPKETREVSEARPMRCWIQAGALDCNGEDVGGKWEDGHLLYDLGDWYLMRVNAYSRTDFYGGYAIGRIKANDLQFK